MNGILRFPALSASIIKNTRLFHRTNINNMVKGPVHAEPGRVNPFSMAGILKHYELLPLVVIVAAGAVALGGYGIYFCNSRSDVKFRKRSPYESMDLMNPPVLKMVTTIDYREFEPLTEVTNLYKEMAEEEARQKAEKKQE